MVFSGDGGFQTCAQCLSTQTRFGLNPIIFVIKNGVYGVEQWLADATVFAPESKKPFYKSCNLHPWNYSKLSEVFGCRGWKASTYGELEDAMTSAKEIRRIPSIIEVIVSSRSIPSNATWKTNSKMIAQHLWNGSALPNSWSVPIFCADARIRVTQLSLS